MTSGKSLKLARINAEATQRDVARYMGISASRVSVIERGGNAPRTAVNPDTVKRYLAALAAIRSEKESGESTTWRVEMMGGIGSVQEQYRAGKMQGRLDIRLYPHVETVEAQIQATTPAATVIGYMDGVIAAGGSFVLLDEHGTIVNRRIG